MLRVRRAELVVVEELDSRLRKEVLEAFEVLVRAPRSSGQGQHLDPARADALGPDVVLAVHANQLDSRRLDLAGAWWCQGFFRKDMLGAQPRRGRRHAEPHETYTLH